MVSRRRNTELGLLVMVVVIIGAAYVLASLGSEHADPANIGPFLLMVLGLMLFAHLAVRRLAPDADPILLPVAALLNGIGYVVITSLNERPGRAAGHVDRSSASWAFVGDADGRAPHPSTSSATATRSPSSASVCCCSRSSPASAGRSTGRAIWVSLGPIGFQPGELAKIVAGDLLRVLPRREARAAGDALVAGSVP